MTSLIVCENKFEIRILKVAKGSTDKISKILTQEYNVKSFDLEQDLELKGFSQIQNSLNLLIPFECKSKQEAYHFANLFLHSDQIKDMFSIKL